MFMSTQSISVASVSDKFHFRISAILRLEIKQKAEQFHCDKYMTIIL